MIKHAIYSIFFFTLCGFGCGPDISESRNYDNPNDPNGEIDDEDPDQISENSEETPGKKAIDGSGCLLGECDPPPNTAFNFANVFELTPEDCSEAYDAKIFDAGSSFDVFVLANCGERNQVYYFGESYSGKVLSSSMNVSSECDSGDTGVTNFVVARGTSSYFMAYICKTGNASYKTFANVVDFDGLAGSATVFESYTSYSGPYLYYISWNPVAETFGLARNSKFQRFDLNGNQVGGPITISNKPISSLDYFDGSWLVIHSFNGEGTHCSRISSIGTLQCNEKTLLSGVAGFLDKQTVIRSNRSWNDGKTLHFLKSDFTSSTCTVSGESAEAYVVNQKYSPSENQIFNTMKLNASYGVILYKTESKLILATIPMAGKFMVHAESSVTGFSSLENGNLLKANDRIYVSYVKEGRAYVSFSNETLN